jgi:hypothetical protein
VSSVPYVRQPNFIGRGELVDTWRAWCREHLNAPQLPSAALVYGDRIATILATGDRQ